jgi:hypothetical protein
MAAVVWAPTLASIDAALATATATDLAIGTPIRAWLYTIGTRYDTLYTAEADAAKASSATQTAAALATWTSDVASFALSIIMACPLRTQVAASIPPSTGAPVRMTGRRASADLMSANF